jgi:hypothetical protein
MTADEPRTADDPLRLRNGKGLWAYAGRLSVSATAKEIAEMMPISGRSSGVRGNARNR